MSENTTSDNFWPWLLLVCLMVPLFIAMCFTVPGVAICSAFILGVFALICIA